MAFALILGTDRGHLLRIIFQTGFTAELGDLQVQDPLTILGGLYRTGSAGTTIAIEESIADKAHGAVLNPTLSRTIRAMDLGSPEEPVEGIARERGDSVHGQELAWTAPVTFRSVGQALSIRCLHPKYGDMPIRCFPCNTSSRPLLNPGPPATSIRNAGRKQRG